jgi:hypothetical protein
MDNEELKKEIERFREIFNQGKTDEEVWADIMAYAKAHEDSKE